MGAKVEDKQFEIIAIYNYMEFGAKGFEDPS